MTSQTTELLYQITGLVTMTIFDGIIDRTVDLLLGQDSPNDLGIFGRLREVRMKNLHGIR